MNRLYPLKAFTKEPGNQVTKQIFDRDRPVRQKKVFYLPENSEREQSKASFKMKTGTALNGTEMLAKI